MCHQILFSAVKANASGLKELIRSGAGEAELRAAATAYGLQWLSDDGRAASRDRSPPRLATQRKRRTISVAA